MSYLMLIVFSILSLCIGIMIERFRVISICSELDKMKEDEDLFTVGDIGAKEYRIALKDVVDRV